MLRRLWDFSRGVSADDANSDKWIRAITLASVAVLVVAILGNLYYVEDRQRTEILADTRVATQNLARVIEEQAGGSVNAADVALASIARSLQILSGRNERHNPEIHDLLRANLQNLPFVRAIWVLDANGDMIHDSDNLPERYNLSDRQYFRVHRDTPGAGLFIDAPVLGKLGVWFVGASRRVQNADGSFGGVVTLAIAPSYFERFYESVSVGRQGVISMATMDGTMVARVPLADELRGKKINPLPTYGQMQPVATDGTYHAISKVDGIERIYSFRKVKDLPLVVIAGLGVADQLASWQRSAWANVAGHLALVAVITWLAWLTLSEIRHRSALNRALLHSQRRYELAVSSGNVWDTNVRTGIGHMAPNLKRQLGYAPHEVEDTVAAFEALLHPQDLGKLNQVLHNHFHKGALFQLQFRARAKSGDYRWFEIRGQGRHDHSSGEILMAGTVFDITEEKRAEIVLRAAELRMRKLIDGLGPSMMVGLLTPEGILLEANQPALTAAGLTLTDVRGTPAENTYWFTHSQSAQVQLRAAIQRAAAGEPSRYDVQIRVAGGQLVWVDFSLQPLRDDTGQVVFLVPSGMIIDERKRAEQAVQESEQNFRQLAENIHEVFWLSDPVRDQMIYVSPASESIWGRPSTELCASPNAWLDAIAPADRERMYAAAAHANKVTGSYDEEYRVVRPDGSTRWIHDRAFPVRDASGAVYRIAGVAEDITERKRAEALEISRRAVLRLIVEREPLHVVLDALLRLIEGQSPDMLGSVLLLDEDGKHLRHGAAPSLPETFTKALDGESIGESAGSCGTAVHRREPVIVVDIATDPLWHEYRDIALAHGLRACWSTPIFDDQRLVLGTFAMYFRSVRKPDQADFRLIEIASDTAAIAIARDREERAIRTSEARFRLLAESSPDAVLIHSEERIVFVNQALVNLLGATSAEDLLGRPATFMVASERQESEEQRLTATFAGHLGTPVERTYRRLNGSTVEVEIAVAALVFDNKPAAQVTVRDITQRKKAEARIEQLATHDALTGLPNRALVLDRITQAIAHARRVQGQFAVVFLDLDRFKVLNDAFGHPFGDAVLKLVGDRLGDLVRDSDTVARQSGDEFLILLADLRKSADAYIIVQKIVDAFEQPLTILGREVFVTASIGVTVYPQDAESAEGLIDAADVAMYRAKDLGRNTYQFFTRAMSEETQRKVDLETKLRGALAGNQLHLAYQPKVDLASGHITGCEALLRWTHPVLGVVPPAQFIPIAEDSGLIVPLGDWVLRTACAQCKAWIDAGLPQVNIAVNISARQFLQQDVAAWVTAALAQTGLAPQHLELELTESLLAQDVEKVINTISQLKAAGIKLSIDDFGTGYSSLSYLRRFRVNALKIDQSFVRNLLTDPDDTTIALAVISLAHSLRMKAVAEGVETADHARFLRLHQCDEMQGYYFSKPVTAPEIEVMLRSGKRLSLPPDG